MKYQSAENRLFQGRINKGTLPFSISQPAVIFFAFFIGTSFT